MKKRRLIGLATLLMSLGIAGCQLTGGGGGGSTTEDGWVATKDGHYEIKDGKKGPVEQHVLVPYEGDKTHTNIEATCTLPGKVYKICSVCKKVIEDTTDKLGHNMVDDGGTTATCESGGTINQKCTRCDYTESKTQSQPLGHQWGTAETVNAKVKKATCGRTGCTGAVEYVIDVSTAGLQLASGSAWKTDPSTGAFKLKEDGQSMSFTFDLPAGFQGKIYQRGYMDSYKNNYEKKVFYQTNNHSNIDVTVNGTAVDMSAQQDVVFSAVLGDTDEDKAKDNSDVKDVLIGNVTLSTTNTITYKRVETLNMIISAFVFVDTRA